MAQIPVKLFNTLSRKKEILKPIHPRWVGLYACGPTVYDFAHIGNLRTYIFEDVLRRTLERGGYRVKHVMNITDVDDKTIRRARESGRTLKSVTREYEKVFLSDLKKLHIALPWKLPRATEHIEAMIRLIAILLRKKYAYEKDGSIYFRISRFGPYGRLGHLNIRGLRPGARIDADEYAKEHAHDFVLWKKAKPGEPSWKAPFGKGRPGWHIECSAMSGQYLGQPLDIHAGGVDLIFPHHENEIAQSESARQKTFARHWIHGAHLLVNGEKMAKSLGNVITLRELEQKNIDPLAFRYFILGGHYRSKLNVTGDALRGAQQGLNRLYDFIRLLLAKKQTKRAGKKNKRYAYERSFEKALFDDLDTPQALAIVWNVFHDYHKNPRAYNPREILRMLYDFDRVLGLGFKKIKKNIIPSGITKLLEKRESFRKEKRWAEADAIRQTLLKKGWMIDDTSRGSILKREMRQK